jgi:hypothetical protein
MIRTAFQIGAFQFTGFQEGLAIAGGGWRRFWHSMQLAEYRRKQRERERKKKKEEEEEDDEETAPELVALRIIPAMLPTQYVNFVKQMRVMQERKLLDEAAEMAEFEELMKLVYDVDHIL